MPIYQEKEIEIMIELKKCPFCGGNARLFVDNGVMVICTKCKARTKNVIDTSPLNRTCKKTAVEIVINAWNRRYEPTEEIAKETEITTD